MMKTIETKIASWQKYAEEEKAAAETYKWNFCLWQMHDQRYCIALNEIAKLEKELELVKAGWGSITA